MIRQKIVQFILRLAISFTFIFISISGFIKPIDLANYYPSFLVTSFSEKFIYFLSFLELIFGIWIIYGKKIFLSVTLTSIFFFLAIVFNLTSTHAVLSILPVFLISFALAIWHYPRIRVMDKKGGYIMAPINLTPDAVAPVTEEQILEIKNDREENTEESDSADING